jgi:predicted DNA-binding transcriptional regulator AlpA
MQVKPAFLRLKDAAVHCGISPQMLQKLHGTKEGPPRIKKGRCVLFAIRDLDEWMAQDREEAA